MTAVDVESRPKDTGRQPIRTNTDQRGIGYAVQLDAARATSMTRHCPQGPRFRHSLHLRRPRRKQCDADVVTTRRPLTVVAMAIELLQRPTSELHLDGAAIAGDFHRNHVRTP